MSPLKEDPEMFLHKKYFEDENEKVKENES